jgi:hypothetical protein
LATVAAVRSGSACRAIWSPVARDAEPGEAAQQHGADVVGQRIGPERDVDVGQMLVQEAEHPRRVRDVADIYGLP